MAFAIEHRIAGGKKSSDPTPVAMAQQVEGLQAFTNAHTLSKAIAPATWHNEYIPHETKLALNTSSAFPSQPSVNKPGY